MKKLERVDARGSTDLHGGWAAGCDQSAGRLGVGDVGRCLLLTDGQANAGITDRDGVLAGPSEALGWSVASDAANDAQGRDVIVDREVATLCAARARAEALELNRQGNFAAARARLERTARRIVSSAGGDAELKALAEELLADASQHEVFMSSMDMKKRHFASLNVMKSGARDGQGVRDLTCHVDGASLRVMERRRCTANNRIVTVWDERYCVVAAATNSTTKQRRVVELARAEDLLDLRVAPFEGEDAWAGIAEVHDAAYVEAVRTGEPRRLAESQGFSWSPAFAESVARIWNGHLAACRLAMREGVVFHPVSGAHHAGYASGSGFCTFNFLVGSARSLVTSGIGPVAIVDLDAHPGDGTYRLAKEESRIALFDIAGGAWVSVASSPHVEYHVARDLADYRQALGALPAFLDRVRPALVQYQAGMDPLEDDPIGGISGVDAGFLRLRDRFVIGHILSRGIPLVINLAGGYIDGVTERLHVETVRIAVDALRCQRAGEVCSFRSRVTGRPPYHRSPSNSGHQTDSCRAGGPLLSQQGAILHPTGDECTGGRTMKNKMEERYGVPPRRRESFERVLIPAGKAKLGLDALEQKCLARLTRLVADATLWDPRGIDKAWRMGGYSILVVETTVALEAELYVQFWSEPQQPVDWEVSSGNFNRRARRFVTARAKSRLGEMGFTIGAGAGNFRKKVTVANRGDVEAVAHDVLRIYHDALGYRGATPLVAKLIKAERSGRAVVHHGFKDTDATMLLGRLGYETRLNANGKRPVIEARSGDLAFLVTLDAPVDKFGTYRCLDFVAAVGNTAVGSAVAWGDAVNRVNGLSRVARAWVDPAGNVVIGTSISANGGVTEEYIANAVAGWHHAVAGLLGGPPKGRKLLEKDSRGGPAEDLETEESEARPVIH